MTTKTLAQSSEMTLEDKLRELEQHAETMKSSGDAMMMHLKRSILFEIQDLLIYPQGLTGRRISRGIGSIQAAVDDTFPYGREKKISEEIIKELRALKLQLLSQEKNG